MGNESGIDIPLPETGRLTFDAEGREGGRHHSRRLHVPTDAGGLTVGRGYDMKARNEAEIRRHLVRAGVAAGDARRLARARGRTGAAARAFIVDAGLEDFEIAPEAQLVLFRLVYDEIAADARRLATKPDVTRVYGATDWEALHPAIRDLVVDLRYRGDYTPRSRRFLQAHVARNDLVAFAAGIADERNWPGVPRDRFLRRRAFARAAVAGETKRRDPDRPPPAEP